MHPVTHQSIFFHRKSATSLLIIISRDTNIDCILLNNFFESLKVALANMLASLMMSVNVATLGLLKIKVFWIKGHDIIIFVHDITNKALSRDSNYILDVLMWLKFGNSCILWEKLSKPKIVRGWPGKLVQ